MALSTTELDRLAGTVNLVARPDIAEEIRGRIAPPGGTTPVYVTELVDVRYAYWRRVAPLPPSPERAERMEQGRSLHERMGRAVSAPEFLEVRVERDGIVGKIDLFEDRPTEIKTTERPLRLESLPADRPQFLEQLAMYCALVDRIDGRLVLLTVQESQGPLCTVGDVRFRDLAGIRVEMNERAVRFRQALTRGSPRELPRCRWFGRGCEFQEQAVCDCTGGEPPLGSLRALAMEEFRENPEESRRLSVRFAELPPEGGAASRFHALVYPRRAYFERTQPLIPERVAPGASAAGRPSSDWRRGFRDAVRAGPVGESTRQIARPGFPPEMVECFRGLPVLARGTRARWAPPPERMPRDQPQYFLELGLRAAAVGESQAYLVLGYESADRPDERVRVYEVHFGDPNLFRAWAESRERALADALAHGTPFSLPACPAWMFASCPYRSDCRCGTPEPGGAVRVQR